MTDDELKGLFNAMREELLGELRNETSTLRHDFEVLRQENAAMHAETRRHFDVALEGARHETRLVAESVLSLDQKLTARIDDVDQRMEQGFADTHAMIKFARTEPDRRMRRRTKPS